MLMQFGGPDSLEAVEPFLYNLFCDPDIVEFPLAFILQKPIAKYISWSRAKTVSIKYGEIGGKSPIIEQTVKQEKALQLALNRHYGDNEIFVCTAMRYWKPFTSEVVKNLLSKGITDVVLLPLYAQFSVTNAASSFHEWERVTKQLGVSFNEKRINEYYENPLYIEAFNERIDSALLRFPNPKEVFILFSAHGTPVNLVERGDPYSHQIKKTMELIMTNRNQDHEYTLAFQSKVGPRKWLTPTTDDTIVKLISEGNKNILVVPIAFVSDHIETLHELNIESREIATHNGITQFEVCEGLNDSALFIKALTDISLEAFESM